MTFLGVEPETRPARRARRRRRFIRSAAVTIAVLGAFSAIAVGGWYLAHDDPGGKEPACRRPGDGGGPAPGSVTVRVLNGTTRAGLARDTAAELAARGFRVVGIGNAAAALRVAAQVRYGPGDGAAARMVGEQLAGTTYVIDRRVGNDVLLILGDRFRRLRTPGEIRAAQRRAPRAAARATPTPSPTCR